MANSNEYMREYMLARYYARRAEAIALLGGKCAECGVSNNLEIDHIDASKKSFELAKLWSYSKDKFLAELDKCQLLCKNHHEKKSIIDRGFKPAKGTHGTLPDF